MTLTNLFYIDTRNNALWKHIGITKTTWLKTMFIDALQKLNMRHILVDSALFGTSFTLHFCGRPDSEVHEETYCLEEWCVSLDFGMIVREFQDQGDALADTLNKEHLELYTEPGNWSVVL